MQYFKLDTDVITEDIMMAPQGSIILEKTGNKPRFRHTLRKEDESLDKLDLKDHEVKVKVAYSGLNFADVMMMRGLYPDAPALPFVPGYEVSGHIEALGSDAKDKGFKVGDAVVAGCYFGGYSSEVTVSVRQMKALPQELSLEEGASLVVSYMTAFMAFHELLRVRAHDVVMVDCASGSLGALSIELLKGMGVKKVYGLTSRESKLDEVNRRGYEGLTREQWEDSDFKVDAILNSLGGKSLKENYDRLKPTGRMVALGASSFMKKGKLNIFQTVKEFIAMPKFSFIDLMNDNLVMSGLNVLRLFEEDDLIQKSLKEMVKNPPKPVVDKVFEAKDVEKALEYLGSGQSKGKVLLKW